MSGTDLIAELEARNLIHDSTDRDALRAAVADGPVAIYYGCDPTADSLHVGNLIGLVMLRRFQDAGHRPIALAGGATGMVGDPSGRSDERNLLDDDTLNHNVASIKEQISRIVDLGSGGGELVDNRDWTQPITILEFLRDVGKHVTVNQMLARESIKLRVNSEHGISFTEFSYMLLQANDYLWLHDHLGCSIQIGGSDQWGNIIAGVDLIRRKRAEHVHAFSWPLLTAPDGSKLGKTTGARVWLDAAKTSPYQFRQHWMQAPDDQVDAQLLTFSLQPVEQIRAIVAEHVEAPHLRFAQRALADEMTALVHGAPAAVARPRRPRKPSSRWPPRSRRPGSQRPISTTRSPCSSAPDWPRRTATHAAPSRSGRSTRTVRSSTRTPCSAGRNWCTADTCCSARARSRTTCWKFFPEAGCNAYRNCYLLTPPHGALQALRKGHSAPTPDDADLESPLFRCVPEPRLLENGREDRTPVRAVRAHLRVVTELSVNFAVVYPDGSNTVIGRLELCTSGRSHSKDASST
jgi:tyrosyl-tRNA synthetase